MLRFRILVPLLVALATSTSVAGRQETSQGSPQLAYTLNVRLDAPNRLIVGRGRVRWRNPSTTPATELRFQLAWNAWRDGRSTWMREHRLAGDDPLLGRTDEDLGFIDVTSLTRVDRPADSLLAGAHFVAPDDRNADDRTVFAVPMGEAIAPGATVELEIAWNAHVPRPFDRAGVIDHTFIVASWFPQLGVLDDDGWHCHQLHANTGSFVEFAGYDVQLTTPQNWFVAASGIAVSAHANADGTTTHRYAADRLRDFAWTTGADFVERTDRLEQANGSPVALRLLLQPEHVDQADREFAAIREAMHVYETWLGPYPWPQLTMVDPVAIINPRAQGQGVAAAAYPMLMVAGTRWVTPWTTPIPEETITRQVGREFWTNLVAPDVVAHPWMDAGIAGFALQRVLPEAFPQRFVVVDRYFGGLVAWPYTDVTWPADSGTPAGDAPGLSQPAQEPTAGEALRWLATLAAAAGPRVTDRVLSGYFTAGAQGHPDPATLMSVARSTVSGDVSWFVDGMSGGGTTFDYGVREVVTAPTETGSIDSTVIVERLADGVLPVDIRVTFGDGATAGERWNGRDESHVLKYRHGTPAIAVDIDPDDALRLERHRTNNSWAAQPVAGRAATKWSIRWLVWFQHTLMTYAFFV